MKNKRCKNCVRVGRQHCHLHRFRKMSINQARKKYFGFPPISERLEIVMPGKFLIGQQGI